MMDEGRVSCELLGVRVEASSSISPKKQDVHYVGAVKNTYLYVPSINRYGRSVA